MRMVLLSPAVALVCLSMAILLSGRLRARMRTVARRPYGDRTRAAAQPARADEELHPAAAQEQAGHAGLADRDAAAGGPRRWPRRRRQYVGHLHRAHRFPGGHGR